MILYYFIFAHIILFYFYYLFNIILTSYLKNKVKMARYLTSWIEPDVSSKAAKTLFNIWIQRCHDVRQSHSIKDWRYAQSGAGVLEEPDLSSRSWKSTASSTRCSARISRRRRRLASTTLIRISGSGRNLDLFSVSI